MDKITKLDGGTLEERIKEMKEFFGLRQDQSFQDLDVDIEDVEDENKEVKTINRAKQSRT